MKKFFIKVNGSQYEVEVEEVRDGSTYEPQVSFTAPAPAPTVAPAPAAPSAPKVEAKKQDTAVPAGAETITAPMPGTILDVRVNSGDTVKKGQILLILEAMKMENEIMAPHDGTITTVNTSKGASVNAGDLLISMK